MIVVYVITLLVPIGFILLKGMKGRPASGGQIVLTVAAVALVVLSSSSRSRGIAAAGALLIFLGWLLLMSGLLRPKGAAILHRAAFAPMAAVGEERRVEWPIPGMARMGRRGADGIYTELVCPMAFRAPHLRIASRDWAGEFHPDARMTPCDVPFGSYTVHSTSATLARAFLGAAVRTEIEQIDRLHSGSFLLELRPRTLIVRAQGRIDERGRFHEFVRIASALAVRLRDLMAEPRAASPLPEAVFAPAPVPVPAPEGAICQVCGCGLDQEIVACSKCRTPHHEDCWNYNRVCSVYGCGGRAAMPGGVDAPEEIVEIRDTDPDPPPRRRRRRRRGARPMGRDLPPRTTPPPGFSGAMRDLADRVQATLRSGTVHADGRRSHYAEFACALPTDAPSMNVGSGQWRDAFRPSLRDRFVASLDRWQHGDDTRTAVQEVFASVSGPVMIDIAPEALVVRASSGRELDLPDFTRACTRLAEAFRA